MLIPRKRCPKCKTTFEGEEVRGLFSCDVCGNGYVSTLEDLDTDADQGEHRLPRTGAPGNLTHTRDGF